MPAETLDPAKFTELFDRSIATGARNSDFDARVFTKHLGLPETEIPAIRRVLLREVPAPLYEGVHEFTASALEDGHFLTIWTEGETLGNPDWEMPGFLGQHQKVVSSGIMDTVRDALPDRDTRKAHFSVTSVEKGKVDSLEAIIARYEQEGVKRIVLVDDKAKVVEKAEKKLAELREQGILTADISVYWLNQGHHVDKVPTAYESKADFLAAHPNVQEVHSFTEFSGREKEAANSLSTGYILDWDHTLSDTTARSEGIRTALNKRIESVYLPEQAINTVQYLDPQSPAFQDIYQLLGLQDRGIPQDRVLMHSLGGGISFVNVLRVNWDGTSYVVKFENNPERMWRMDQEKTGYSLLSRYQTPFQERLPKVYGIDQDREIGGFIVMEYFDGPNLRDAMKRELLSDRQIVDAVHQVLDLEYELYKGQVDGVIHGHNGDWFSMAKEEWPDTDEQMSKIVSRIAEEVGLTPEEVGILPIRAELNGESVSLPSLTELHSYMERVVCETPPVVMPLLFNDLSQGNVVTIAERDGSVTVRIVDPQWVREWSNPQADLVRPIKSVSSTTVHVEGGSVGIEDGVLVFRSQADIPPLLFQIEDEALSRIPEFGALIGDPTLPSRVREEMAASQWREVALIAKGRGNLGQIGFNLWNMHRFFRELPDIKEVA